jgi:hypothetical protein
MVNTLSKELDLQFLIVTHDENLKEGDKVFLVENKNKKSKIKEE